MSDEEREEKELDLTSSEVVTKYKSAAEIVNKALQLVLSHCKPKAKIVDLCEKGDAFITEQAGNMYKNVKKKKIERGIAFPTCISVNNTVCHFSPFSSDETVLEDGDVLKIDMGCHIDGFIAVVGHTHVLHEGPVTGRAADVIAAVNTAAEVALRLVRPGKKNKDVTEGIQKVAAAYDCKIVEGVLSHQMKQFVIDGNKVVLSVSNPDTRVDEAEFEENEVYSIDIVASTGEGKPKLLDEKQTTIYKRAVDKNYHLKMKASRFIFSEISQKFPIMPFSARALEEKRARLGLVECVIHDLLQPYPVLHEKTGDIVAQMKFTVLLMPNGSDRITSHPLQEMQPTKMVVDDPEIKAWLALPTKTKKKGGGKKKKDWWIMASRRALFLKSQSEKAKLAADGSKSRGIHKHDTSNLGAIIDVTSPPRDAPAFSPVAGRNTTDTTSQQTIHETTNASPQPEATPAKKSSARDKGKGAAAETSDALPQRKKRAAADPEHSPKRSKPDKLEPYGEFSQGTSVLQSAAGGVSWTVFKKTARTADMKYMKGLKTQPRMHGLADALMKASQWAMGFGVYAHALETAQEGPVAKVRAELESVQKEAEELKLQKEAAEDTARIAKAKWAEADDSLKKLGDAWERLEAAKTAAEAKAAEAEAERLKAEARAEFEAAENTRLCLELNGHSAVECARRFQASAIYTQLLAAQSETDAEEARHLTVAQLKHKCLLDPAFDENLINLAGDETGQTIELSAEELAAIENAPPIEEDEFFPLLGGADRTPAEADPAQFSNPQEETEPHP